MRSLLDLVQLFAGQLIAEMVDAVVDAPHLAGLGMPVEAELRGVSLTQKGRDLWLSAQAAFNSLETRIDELRGTPRRPVTIATTTYFASRFLSPRLMMFMKAHPQIRLRLQPMIDLMDLHNEGIDLAIRWGRGEWTDVTVRRLFACPAFATDDREALALVQAEGLASAVSKLTLLADRSGSVAWAD